jgi:hypothetical protein
MEAAPPIEHLVDAMMQSFGQLATLVEHMSEAAARNPSPEAQPVPAVLRALLVEVLAPLAGGADDTAVATAAQVLCAATATVGAELYLVPAAYATPCEPRRCAGRRRARGETR